MELKHFLVVALAINCQLLCAQTDTTNRKTGWNFGILPAISFDSDLGFQYGGLVNAFYYGDGSRYPRYDHSLYAEFSRYTRGSGIRRFFYNSDRLIPGVKVSFDASYLTDLTFPFFGFNGAQAVYDKQVTAKESSSYISRLFYACDRKMLRVEPIVSSTITGKLRWVGGLGIYHFDAADLQVDKINKGKSESKKIPDTATLFSKYKTWGLIPSGEAAGGWFNHVIVGVVYDSRDVDANPGRGLMEEILAGVVPGVAGNKQTGIKLTLSHRHYISIVPRRLTFCYRVAWLYNSNNTPWYARQMLLKSFPMSDVSEGFGGSKTIRGVLLYRVVGQDVGYGNFEFRYMFGRTRIMKQNVHLALNTFYDVGMVTRLIPVDFSQISAEDRKSYFSTSSSDKPHQGYGLGLRVIMNENFIVALEYGRAVNKTDGESGFYINLNFLF